MTFPLNPADGDLHIEGVRLYVYDSILFAWRLRGVPADNRSWNGYRISDHPLPRTGIGTDVANKDYVDTAIAAGAVYRGLWAPAANIPDLIGAAAPTINGENYICATANPAIPEVVTAAVPGLQGKTVHDGNRIIWAQDLAIWQMVSTGLDIATADDRYVNVTGDTMSGDLRIAATNPSLYLSNQNGAGSIFGMRNAVARWLIRPGNTDNEAGNDAGSNFVIARFSDTGTQIGTPFSIDRATGIADFDSHPTVGGLPLGDDRFVNVTGDTMTGSLQITMANPFITLDRTGPGQNTIIAGGRAGQARWVIALGDATPEIGPPNSGSNLRIQRHDDAGGAIDTAFSINRRTGVADFVVPPTVGGQPIQSGPPVATSDNPPANPLNGELWWESDSGDMFVWFVDVDSGQWVQVNAADIQDAPFNGRLYARQDGVWREVPDAVVDGKIYGRRDKQWVEVPGATTQTNPRSQIVRLDGAGIRTIGVPSWATAVASHIHYHRNADSTLALRINGGNGIISTSVYYNNTANQIDRWNLTEREVGGTNYPIQVELVMGLTRPNNNFSDWAFQSRTTVQQSSGLRTFDGMGRLAGTAGGFGTRILELQFFVTSGGWDGWMEINWMGTPP
jgi:hypothetical protein